jgi:hypothetical protein
MADQQETEPFRSSNVELDQGDGDDAASLSTEPLDRRICEIIASLPNRTIRPARLAAELGFSVDDANAELCGLLAAVGGGEDGASFRFETVEGQPNVMVFTFPPDFEKRALRKRRRDDLAAVAREALLVAVRILKIVTAFGLILSLLILSVAAVAGLVAAMVALSQGRGSRQHRSLLMHRVRSVFFAVRQLLWCYAVFGPEGEGQDPFLKEISYDLWLAFSVCCGNPGSIFFWFRANQLSRRRRRAFRGWGGRAIQSDVDGVHLIQRGTWHDGQGSIGNASSFASDDRQGLLSIAVEFLFGPTPFSPGPSEADRWRLRAAALVQLTAENPQSGVALDALMPYAESPPDSLHDTKQVVAQGMTIVGYFNGVPSKEQGDFDAAPGQANFIFPELMAESAAVPRYERSADNDDGTWMSLLCNQGGTTGRNLSSSLPTHLKEDRYRFTQLKPKQLLHCVVLGTLNLVGIIWFGQSISPGGIIEVPVGTPVEVFLQKGLLPVLRFYAVLFFALPSCRLLLILALNSSLKRRNERRARLVSHSE